MAEYTLGIDMGTSGVKAAALDLRSCKLVVLAMLGYDNSPQQLSTMLWEATAAVVRKVASGIDARAIRAISFSGQMHGTVLCDARGEVIDPIINWQDKRCDVPLAQYGQRSTIERMMELLDGPEFTDLGIDSLLSGYLGATLFHIKENAPALFEQVRRVVLPGDFIRGKLLGGCDYATDPTNAFSTGLFNARLNEWHTGVIGKLGLPRELLPAVRETTGVAGRVPPAVAQALGLAPGTPVVYGGGDNQVSLLGNGLIADDSPALINIGTGAQLSKVTSQYARVPGLDTRTFFDGRYAFVGASMGGGRNYARLREALCQRAGADISYEQMNQAAAGTPIGAGGLVYRVGSRRDSDGREGFAGRTELCSIGHQSRAVLEGVLLDLYAHRPPASAGGPGFMVGAGKGLQNSQVWAQMAADLFDCPIKVTNFENAVWGAAVIAAAGVGAIRDVREAFGAIEYSRELAPDAARTAQYRDLAAERLASQG